MSVVTIIAGGWSASLLDLKKLPGTIIAVNDAAYYAPRWDICVSMDRLWTENRWRLIEATRKPVWLRRAAVKNISAKYNLINFPHVHEFYCDHTSTTLSDMPDTLNGTHSGSRA